MLFSYAIVAVGAFLLWQLAHFRYGSWRIFVVAVDPISLWQLALFIRYDRYYKAVTFLSFTLNSIKFSAGTTAIPDIFPNFASTFPTDEMNIKIQ